MTAHTFDIVRGIVLLVMAVGAIGWLMVRCLKRSDDPRTADLQVGPDRAGGAGS